MTAALGFDGARAARGKRGEGFRYMLILMNNARSAWGSSRSACARRRCGWRASTPRNGVDGKTVDRHEMIADYLDEWRSTSSPSARWPCRRLSRGARQKKKLFAEHGAGRTDLDAARLQREGKQHEKLARRVTPS